ncbi:hypothetical protein GP486_004662 [Trichoglossum hirsutum]|uniref:BZIP domain-containing protein n=1 Tax=Trichoglossum hirsutum TaxID=265104 RepID=A0A9P8LAQ6_9PEZI|nr:hypothetical protein GP486_004662 [Trichoglossum hirsutum]
MRRYRDVDSRPAPGVAKRWTSVADYCLLDPPTTINQPPDQTSKLDAPSTSNANVSQPLAPPPRPAQQSTSDTPDYFSAVHNSNHFSLEPNPFEQSFGNPSVETPGKSLLPPVAALTSPASLLPGGASGGGFNWPNSLRSGPLSPAMLTGPTGSSDLFDGHLRGGFPTPNESSIRTGLTPGGGGSMFPPSPSPNSQALLQQLASGGATPGTLDFHRTALTAAAARNKELASHNQFASNNTDLSQTQGQDQLVQDIQGVTMESKVPQQVQGVQNSTDLFGQHDANDAANGLYLLAQARSDPQSSNQFAMPGQQNAGPDVLPPSSVGTQMPTVRQAQGSSPNLVKRSVVNNASGSGSISGSARGASEMSGELSDSAASEQAKPNTRNRGKRNAPGKAGQGTSNGRRKADASPAGSRAQNNKKSKGNSGSAQNIGSSDDDIGMPQSHESGGNEGKKMTDEEKRKNFLERNRVAALKCRQRKKQWLANLQAKVEIFSSENDALSAQVTQLREEIVNLKTLLLAHKDCPVSQAQGMTSMGINNMPDFNHHANPYGMAMAGAGPVMTGQSNRASFHDGSTQMGTFRKGLGA